MNPISSLHTAAALPQQDNTATRMLSQSLDHGPKEGMKSTFQDFVAGTFYQEMMKSVRKMHGKPAYMHGGQAEEMFQNQLDQQLSQDLAHSNGDQFADSLYQAFMTNGRA
jgi:Rod binding domain-containing protein